ncbi:MAG: response regulator transcription factor [Bacteroidetes bacterium]|nr:response regulator transcription factor [Bacteroidota bacterium]MBL0095405.1 response regulator transcription factor [Bacteroidota bacterium]
MKILIIEDEKPAADRLIKMIHDLVPEAVILATLVSIKSSVEWLMKNDAPDVVMMDIHLADGQSFEIFTLVKVTAPVIFTTAYDEHALDAFKVNSIDYLLKPIKLEDLKRAIDKLKNLKNYNAQQVEKMISQFGARQKEFQKRMVIRFGDTIKMVDIPDVAYFYTEDKINYLCTSGNLRYPIDHNLDELELLLDPAVFFRINRQFIINIHAIDKMLAWSKSRVKVLLKPPTTEDTIVSTERSPYFKDWLIGLK